jgi:alanine dehydrogenase
MEILNPSELSKSVGLKTLEQAVRRSQTQSSLRIGIPKERSADERRVCITPGGVEVLVSNGHQVLIEKNAGADARFPDHAYAEAGAEIAFSSEDVFRKSELIVKVAPADASERAMLKDGQILISAVHLGTASEVYFKDLLTKGVSGIGFEFLQSKDGTFPIVRMMHEITGSVAVQIAAQHLESNRGGPGIMLGGISGIPPATVVILGAGIIAEYAARTALGYGAQVFVMDTDLGALRRLENALDRRIVTAMANQQYLTIAMKSADVVIGAALIEGNKAPCWVTEPMVELMKEGSVIVDTVIDQGGCIETSRATTHSNPVFVKHGVTHYAVPNMPAAVARTATYALNNVIVPYLIQIGDAGGLNEALWHHVTIRNGTYLYKRHLTKKAISTLHNLPYRDIDMLMASRI